MKSLQAMETPAVTMTRAIGLDSNVWRALVDSRRVDDLHKSAKRSHVEVVAIPAVLYEAVRMQPSSKRDRIVRAICRQAWRRSMPEAFLEAEDVRAAIEQHHPDWLDPAPNLRLWYLLRSDWEHGTWHRARADPTAFATTLGPEDRTRLEVARAEARRVANHVRESKLTLERFEPEVFSAFVSDASGQFEAWRASAMNYWSDVLTGSTAHPSSQWLLPWLKTGIDWRAWEAFWLHEVRPSEVPREWMRTNIYLAAATRRQSRGSPADWQIATYLFDFGEFVTADKTFVAVLQTLEPYAPKPFATPILLEGGADAAEQLLALLQR